MSAVTTAAARSISVPAVAVQPHSGDLYSATTVVYSLDTLPDRYGHLGELASATINSSTALPPHFTDLVLVQFPTLFIKKCDATEYWFLSLFSSGH